MRILLIITCILVMELNATFCFAKNASPQSVATQILERLESSNGNFDSTWFLQYLRNLIDKSSDDNKITEEVLAKSAAHIIQKDYKRFLTLVGKTNSGKFRKILALSDWAAKELGKYKSPFNVVSGDGDRQAAIDGMILILIDSKQANAGEPPVEVLADAIRLKNLTPEEALNVFFILKKEGLILRSKDVRIDDSPLKKWLVEWEAFNFEGAEVLLAKIQKNQIDRDFCLILNKHIKSLTTNKASDVVGRILMELGVADSSDGQGRVGKFFSLLNASKSDFEDLLRDVTIESMRLVDSAEATPPTLEVIAAFTSEKKFPATDRYQATIGLASLLNKQGDVTKRRFLCSQGNVSKAYQDFLKFVQESATRNADLCLRVMEQVFDSKLPPDIQSCIVGFK